MSRVFLTVACMFISSISYAAAPAAAPQDSKLECSSAKDGGDVCLSLSFDDDAAPAVAAQQNLHTMLTSDELSGGALSLESEFDVLPIAKTEGSSSLNDAGMVELPNEAPALGAALKSQSDLRRIETFLTSSRTSPENLTVTTSNRR